MNAPTKAATPAKATTTPGALPASLAPRAEGPRIYNLFPLLVGRVSAWTAELPRIADLGFDWIYLNPFHQTGGSRSLYAVADTDRLDERLRDEDGTPDDEQIRRFCAAARAAGISVMTDLVINHTADNARLVQERPDLFMREPDGSIMHPAAVDPDDPSIRTVWGDLAELDYHSPAARQALTEIFSAYVARMQDLGVGGFRCDAAYKVPPEVWRVLIAAAKRKDPACLFAAETLGCTFEEARATAGAGFDYLFNSFAWWDLKAPWALEQYERLRVLAPSIAFPENHDMKRLAAGIGGGKEAVAAQLRTRYALSAFFSAGVLMPIGYEWGYRRALHVVETHPGDRESDTGIDISDDIRAINALKAELPAANVEGAQVRLSAQDAGFVALVRYDTGHHASASTRCSCSTTRRARRSRSRRARSSPAPAGCSGPSWTARRGSSPSPSTAAAMSIWRRASGASSPPPPPRWPACPPGRAQGEGRVVIEAVTPELDGGRSAVKRIVGEDLTVEADIFSDGHEIIAAAIHSRVVGTTEWREDPMVFVDNDRWAGRFPLERNARYEFTLVAWRDPFASWMRDTIKKRDAGVDVRLETIEG